MNPPLFRRDYSAHKLDESELTAEPIALFKKWFAQAAESGATDVNAMTLATSTQDGIPFTRIVLFKGMDEEDEGFVFFTNFNSQKGRQLLVNPHCAVNFYWSFPERQVNIRGKALKLKVEIADEYFKTRPRASQLGAWASEQSEIIDGREVLEKNFEKYKMKYEGIEIPRPTDWGGFSIKPASIEFWQGRIGRLHDRFLYTRKNDGSWKIERLSP